MNQILKKYIFTLLGRNGYQKPVTNQQNIHIRKKKD